MRTYTIWSEGSYWEGHALYKPFWVADIEANSFDEAITKYIEHIKTTTNTDPQIKKHNGQWFWIVGHKHCRLVSNKAELEKMTKSTWQLWHPTPSEPQTFKYSMALEHLMTGNRVARLEWVDRNQYLFLMKSEMFDTIAMPHGIGDNGETITDQIWIKTSKGTVGPYGGCNCDTVAEDWVIY